MTGALVTRRILGAAVALAVTALGGASMAWACSAQATAGINGGQTSGPVGTQLTVTGRDFGPGPVQVRWDSRAGQLLAEGQGPSFSVPITIPQAPAGVHYIVAVQPVGSSTASLAFEVTVPARTNTTSGSQPSGTTATSASAADEESSTSSSSTNTASSTGSSGSTQTAQTAQTGSNTNSSTASTGQTDSTSTATAGSSATQSSSQGSTAPAPSTATSSAAGPAAVATAAPVAPRAASANPAVVTNTAGQAVFGGSSATPVAAVETDSPSAATVSGDTWSGFSASAKPSLLTNDPATPASSGSGLGLGVGLLGAGVVALFAGFAVAEASRKRALAVTTER